MKKIGIALVLAGSSCLAHAENSSVEIYGLIDLNIGKDIGSTATREANGTVSNFGFKGTEDLGGGMSAFFNLKSRFDANNGAIHGGAVDNGTPFWGSTSIVGLAGSFGKVFVGRALSEAAVGSQLIVDPWLWEHVTNAYFITGGGVAHIWYSNSLSYEYNNSGFSFGLQAANQANNSLWGAMTTTPVNGNMRYAAGPVSVGVSYEKTGEGPAKWTTIDAQYMLGSASLRAAIGDGTNLNNATVKSAFVAAVVPVGVMTYIMSYGMAETADVITTAKASAGASYSLSKRTSLYTNVTYDTKVASSKSGVEFGISHAF